MGRCRLRSSWKERLRPTKEYEEVSPPVLAPPEDDCHVDGNGCGIFFDSFAAPTHHNPKQLSQKVRKENFNKQTEGDFISLASTPWGLDIEAISSWRNTI